MKIKEKLKNAFAAEGYLFRLMLKMSGFIGVIIVCFELINGLWWNIGAAYVDKYLIDELIRVFDSRVITTTCFILIAVQLGGKIVSNSLSSVSEVLSEHTQNKATIYLEKKVMHAVSDMDSSFFDDPQNQDAVYAANQCGYTVAQNIGWSVSLVTSIIKFTACCAVFLKLNPLLGIIFLAAYIPGAVIDSRNKKNFRSFSIDNIPENRKKDYYRSLLTSAETAKDVRLYNLADYFKGIYNSLWVSIREKRFKLFRSGAVKTFAAALLTTFGLIAIMAYSIYSVIRGSMTVGEMSLLISLALSAGASFNIMSNQITGHLQYCIPDVIEFLKFIRYENKIGDVGEVSGIKCPATLEFKNVSFRYPNCEKYALKNVSFKLDGSEKIALVGINGSGKTTIVKLLMRFYKPESGEILLNGVNIWDYSKEAYSKIFGVCFQDVNRYALTMRENITLSNIEGQENDTAVENAASASGADRIAAKLEGGYDSNLTREFDDNGAELSGGQWQKVSIARAFFSDAPFIILDEPSSALDPEAEDEIFRSFKRLCENKSGILISHRLSSAILVDKIVLIENGELLETGTHDSLMKKKGRYAELYKMQSEKYIAGKETA